MTIKDKIILLSITIRHLEEHITESTTRKKSIRFLEKLAPNHKLSGNDLLRFNGAVPMHASLLTAEDLNILCQLGLIKNFNITNKGTSQKLLNKLKIFRHMLYTRLHTMSKA